MALKNFRPLTPTQRFKQTPRFEEITKDQAGEISARAAETVRWTQQHRTLDFAPHRRRPQAEISDHRFQAKAS